jgi:hypothetical protein
MLVRATQTLTPSQMKYALRSSRKTQISCDLCKSASFHVILTSNLSVNVFVRTTDGILTTRIDRTASYEEAAIGIDTGVELVRLCACIFLSGDNQAPKIHASLSRFKDIGNRSGRAKIQTLVRRRLLLPNQRRSNLCLSLVPHPSSPWLVRESQASFTVKGVVCLTKGKFEAKGYNVRHGKDENKPPPHSPGFESTWLSSLQTHK